MHAGYHEAKRITVLGSQHFAVLAVRNQHLARLDEFHRNRARHRRAVGTLGEHVPPLLEIGAALLEQVTQGDAGELRARKHAMAVLHRGNRHVAPLHAGVGATLDEVNA